MSEHLQSALGVQLNKPEADQWSLKLSHTEAFRAAFGVETNFDLILRNPDGSIRGGLRGNPNLNPETVRTNEITFRYQDTKTLFETTFYDSTMVNLIGRERAPDNVLDFVNSGSLSLQGIESEFKHEFNDSWWLQGNFTKQQNKSGDGIESFTLVPESMAKLGVVYKSLKGNWRLGVFDTYIGSAPETSIRNPSVDVVNPPADSHHLVSLNISNRLQTSLSDSPVILELYVYNALDETIYYPEIAGRQINTLPARSDRAAYFGVSFNF
ncbi:TonB-dependent receptor domain-containing protein [Pleionea sediminis]|uniref:TonB-dependent receptor domain-containing protein n=1 Tax=Pleionea sediminis TaxID=2569479 RepID=UPI0013DE119C|nr:TonB-dependent receptor [Pleionea sediminis]